MIRKSFFNPFSSLLLALAGLAFLVDVLPQVEGQTGVFAPAVLFLMWLVGGLVRLFYENEAKRSFDRHMFKANHAAVWKRVDACWIQVDADRLVPGDVVRLYAGMLCPVDVTLAKGDQVLVSESSLTGESGQTAKREGETVRAGTTIVDGKASATVLARIADEQPVLRRRARMGTQFGAGAKSICAALVRCMLIVLPFVIMIRGFVLGDWAQALLFALGTAVGLVPEMLPVVTSVCLSGSAHRLKNKQVIVKNVDAMESLGSMDVVCVDKTGTLTEDAAVLEYYTDILGNESEQTLNLAYLESTSQGAAANQLNRAIADACAAPELHLAAKDLGHAFALHASDPFDHVTKASGVKLDATPGALGCLGLQVRPGNHLTIVKGEVESVCTRCAWANFKGELVPMDADGRQSAYEVAEDMRADGIKVLAVAYSTTSADWDDLVLCGFLGFFDRPKASARAAVQALSNLSVEVRVLTGDSASVARSTCSRLGIPADSVITGSMLQAMEESEALIRVGKARVFAELTPAQKAQIVSLIRLSGHIVGYIGDGVNDVPALTSALSWTRLRPNPKRWPTWCCSSATWVLSPRASARAGLRSPMPPSTSVSHRAPTLAISVRLPPRAFSCPLCRQPLPSCSCSICATTPPAWRFRGITLTMQRLPAPGPGRVRGSAALCFILALRARPSTSLRLPFCSWAYAPPSAARPLPRSTRRVERPLSRPSKPAGCWNAHGPNRSCSWCCERAVSATGIVLAHRSW